MINIIVDELIQFRFTGRPTKPENQFQCLHFFCFRFCFGKIFVSGRDEWHCLHYESWLIVVYFVSIHSDPDSCMRTCVSEWIKPTAGGVVCHFVAGDWMSKASRYLSLFVRSACFCSVYDGVWGEKHNHRIIKIHRCMHEIVSLAVLT